MKIVKEECVVLFVTQFWALEKKGSGCPSIDPFSVGTVDSLITHAPCNPILFDVHQVGLQDCGPDLINHTLMFGGDHQLAWVTSESTVAVYKTYLPYI